MNSAPVSVPFLTKVHSKQLFTAHTAELLEGGDYTLWVESRGGDAEGPLQKDKCRVKYLRVEDPVPPPEPIWESDDGLVKVMSAAGGETGDTFTWGNAWNVLGEGFTGTKPGWFVEMVSLRTAPGAEFVPVGFDVKGATEVEITAGEGAEIAAGDYPNAGISDSGPRILTTRTGGSAWLRPRPRRASKRQAWRISCSAAS